MMKSGLYISALMSLAIGSEISAEEVARVYSPDSMVAVTVGLAEGGVPTYEVKYGEDEFIAESSLGLKTTIGDFTKGLKSAGKPSLKKITDSYSLRNIKKSHVEYEANEMTCTFSNADGAKVMDVVFRVSDNDIAFRYKIYSNWGRLSCLVESETTGYSFPEGTTTFLCPQMKAQSGFARTAPSYETDYTLDDAVGKNGYGEGYTFPALFRIADKGWVMLCETGVSSAYCASRLLGNSDGTYRIGYPVEAEFGGVGTVSPGLSLPGYTPWRTITLASDLAPIVETTVMWDNVEPLYETANDYVLGKGSWSWIIGMDPSCNYDEQKRYIDFSAAMGYNYVLIDALWDTQIGRDRMAELSKYAQSKGVALFLWYNSNGYWNDAPQGPRNIMNNLIARRKEMKWLKSIGVKGLKVDFVGGDKQQAMQLYEDILADADEYGLMIIFHGCTVPRGWERMYPNFVSAEAVRASENLSFNQADCDNEAWKGCVHPFLRNSVGSMDFGGSALNKHYSADNKRGRERKTSDVYALATAVLFQSGVQHFALAPNNLNDAPAWAMDFMKNVPTTWDDIKFIDGYPGKYVVLARRSGDKWYVAAINGTGKTLKLETSLPMLKGGSEITVYSDDEKLNGSVATKKLSRKGLFKWTIPANGGQLIVGQ